MKHLTTTERREQAGDILTKGIFRVLANQATQAYAKRKEVSVKPHPPHEAPRLQPPGPT